MQINWPQHLLIIMFDFLPFDATGNSWKKTDRRNIEGHRKKDMRCNTAEIMVISDEMSGQSVCVNVPKGI